MADVPAAAYRLTVMGRVVAFFRDPFLTGPPGLFRRACHAAGVLTALVWEIFVFLERQGERACSPS
jgi:hypothetical protein